MSLCHPCLSSAGLLSFHLPVGRGEGRIGPLEMNQDYFRFRVVRKTTQLFLLTLATLLLPGRLNAADTNSVAPELDVADGSMLAIPKTGFGKDYEFTASIIPQELAATSTGLAGKIVRFELFSDGVDMYEATEGLVVTEDLPARRLLATFPIVRQDDQRVVIDFNKGMRRVFTEAWTSEGRLDLSQRDQVLEVPEARVFEVRKDNGRVVIRQSVQARDREFEANLEARYEMRYFIAPYRPAEYKGKEPNIPDSRYTRYFETDGHIEPGTGRVSAHIARFDMRKPAIFYYSANTPSNYVQAVTDGILYWNYAFGKQVVQAKKAPAGVTAPDASYNVIQWVPWDNAGFAYADDLMDPISGQSQHGQAYITSVFAFMGRAEARILLRSMEEMAEPKTDSKKNLSALSRALPFLSAGPRCDVDPAQFALQMEMGLKDVLASDALTDEAILRISQDYVREVVAHEVGHVLGLRHNFAGSLGGTLSDAELDEWFRAYVAGKPLDAYTNKISTTSVMDYNILKAAAFVGWRMRTVKQALPHDRAAIAWGYADSSEVRDKRMLFGTDEDVGRYGDVRPFDYGDEPVVRDYAEIAHIINLLPNYIIETFIRARAPRNPNDRIPLENVNLSYTIYAMEIMRQFEDIISWYDSDARSLRVESKFDFVGDLNQKERWQAHWKYLTNQLNELGGVDRAVFSFMPVDLKLELKDKPTNVMVVERLDAASLTAKLSRLLTNVNYTNFIGLDDKKYSFTAAERELILKRGQRCFEELEKDLVKRVCKQLDDAKRDLDIEANGNVSEDDALTKLDARIIDLAKYVITARDDTNTIEGKVDKATVSVKAFKYNQETRLAAARMLQSGSYKGWSDQGKSDINDELKKALNADLNIEHFKDFRPTLLSQSLLEWYQEQQEILNLLPPLPKSG